MKTIGALVSLLVCFATTTCLAEGEQRTSRDLRYRPNVAYAYHYRTDQIAPVQRVPNAPDASAHLQSLLVRQVKPVRPVLHFPTRRPMQAVDQLHTRVDIGQHQTSMRRSTAVPAQGTIVAHSHTEIYRKYR